MGRRPTPKRRLLLNLEWLEQRLTPTAGLGVPLDPIMDRYGDQIVTVQAYQDSTRSAFSIFDTGAAALTFSANDQAAFTSAGNSIPIKVPGGAHGEGYSGTITGDVSQPGTIFAAGLHAATISFGASGLPTYNATFGPGSAAVPRAQAFVGTPDGSPDLPTVTGTPILYGGTPSHPGPYAALVNLHGTTLDFSKQVPGLLLTLPDLTFVDPGYQLSQQQGTSAPITIPMSLTGPGFGTSGGITEAQSPVQNNVSVGSGGTLLTGRSFLFDTGAQVTVISTAVARALGLDLSNPPEMTTVSGANGTTQAPGFVLSELDLNGGQLQFTNVPVSVLDVGAGLDGILGTNLWNGADQMLYVQTGAGGPSLTLTFFNTPTPATAHGGNLVSVIGPIANADHGNGLPGVSLKQGQLTGEAFADYNGNGVIDPGEPGLSNVLVYLDLNNSGSYSMGDPSAVTDQNGNFSFPTLAPGTYTLREVPPPNMTLEAPGFTMVQVQNNSATSVNFGNMPMQATSQLNYISALYGQILDRAPDQAGLSGWQQFLAHGGALQSVAQGIWQSTEHLSQEVTGLYQKLLNRAPDSGGLISWVWAMQNNGLTLAGLESDILGSAEFQAQNPTNVAFVAALYREVLNRNPDAAGSATWVGRLNLGMTNAQVVQAFLTSDEFYLDNLSAYYLNFLHRVPDQSGEQAWLLSLRQGRTTLETVAVDFLSSAEFMAWSSQHG